MLGLGRRNKRSEWEGRGLHELVPHRLIAHESTAEGGLRLLEPRFKGPVLGRLLQPRLPRNRAHVHVDLDERGRFLWLSMDGTHSVSDLVAMFGERFPDDAEQVHERVWRYVAVMEHHGFLEFEILPATP